MATRKKGMIFSDPNLRQHLVSINQFYQNSYFNLFEQNIINKLCLPVFVYLRNKKTTTTRITTKVNPPAAALPIIIGNRSLDSAIKKKIPYIKKN